MNSSGRKGADDGLLLKAFGTLSRRNLKSVADQDRCLADLSGKAPIFSARQASQKRIVRYARSRRVS